MAAGEAAVNVTPDAGVVKRVLKAGSGETPPLHARCLVHYVGRLVDGDSVFIDTRAEGEPSTVVAGRDASLQASGLSLAVAKMRVGETASVAVEPDYGYGAKGSFSFPSVPPDARLTYEVELLGFDEVDEAKASSSMLYEERLEAAERRRLEGNRLFQDSNHTDALGKYAMALSYLGQDFMFQLEGPHEAKAQAVRTPILLNMAACHLQLQDYQGAVETASQVLGVEPKNAKALFRRGKARRLAGQTEAAGADLEAALRLSPKDSAVVRELQLLRKSAKEEQRAADQLFKGRFPVPPPKRRAGLVAAVWQWLGGLIWRILGAVLPRGLRERAHAA